MIANTKLEKLYDIADTIYIKSFEECQARNYIPQPNSLVLDEFGNEFTILKIEDNKVSFFQEGISENHYFKGDLEKFHCVPKEEVLTLVNINTIKFFSNPENTRDLIQ